MDIFNHQLYFVLKNKANTEQEVLTLPTDLLKVNSYFKSSDKLKCIFKKEDSNHITLDYKRTVMCLELKKGPELVTEYIAVHNKDKIWPQIIENMNTVGILDMAIYLFNYKAFLIMDTHWDFNLEKDGKRWASLPKEQEWQELCPSFKK